MSSRLKQVCLQALVSAAQHYGGIVYENLMLRERLYEGLTLLWDGQDHIVVLALCWTKEELRNTRDDVLLFTTLMPRLGINKKCSVILLHADELNGAAQSWPAGISFIAIAVNSLSGQDSPPEELDRKLKSILEREPNPEDGNAVANHLRDWRQFLTDPDVVIRRLKQLAKGDELPEGMHTIVEQLLSLLADDVEGVSAYVRHLLDVLWEAR